MAARLMGRTQPRLWTPPLRTLTRRTSLGYDVAEFAAVIGVPLLPWQRWLLIHALELNRDGTPRFREVLTLVGRQCGKTTVSLVLALYKLHVARGRLVLGVAQDLSLARESQATALEMIEACPWLAADLTEIKRGNGQESFRIVPGGPITYDDDEGDESLTLASGGRYKIASNTRKAGRGLSVDLLLCDELREWLSFQAWSALYYTTMARPDAQIWATSNQGDDKSVVLHQLRDAALAERDPSIGLFEWSAPDGCELDDTAAWRQSLPGLGFTISEAAVRTAAATEKPEVFRVEVLCQRIAQLDGAIPWQAWTDCADSSATMESLRDRLAVCFDVAPDGVHATLAVAARTGDGRVRVEIAAAWDSTDAARTELPALLARIKPRAVAWYPTGPAAALATVLRSAVPAVRGIIYTELTGQAMAEACQEFTDLVRSRRILHPADPLLDADVRAAQKINSADGWRFGRKGGAPVDAVYAAAGAVSAALQVPEPRRARIRILTVG